MTSLAHRSARAFAWLLAARWATKLIGLVSTVIVARLLTPQDFGLVAVATSYMAIIEALSALGTNAALIQTRDEDAALYNTAWTMEVARGLLLTLLMASTAGLVAAAVGDDRLTDVIRVLAVLPLVNSLGHPRFVTYDKRLELKAPSLVMVLAKILSVAAVIVLALLYGTYWAIVIAMLVAPVTQVVASYVLMPGRPRFSLARFRSIFAFSGWLMLSNALWALGSHLDNFLLARFVGIRETGIYHMAKEIYTLPNSELMQPLTRVLFPGFSEMSGDRARLGGKLVEVIGILGSILIPAQVGLALVAAEFVPVVLGSQWLEIVPILQITLPFFALGAGFHSVGAAVMAAGATRALFLNNLLYMGLRLPVMIVLIASYGLPGLVGALCLLSVVSTAFQLRLVHRVLTVGPRDVVMSLHRAAVSTGVMAGVVLAVPSVLAAAMPAEPALGLVLAAKVAVGAGTYVATHAILWWLEGRPQEGIEARVLGALATLRSGLPVRAIRRGA